MPRYAPNKMPAGVKRQYFELIRTGISGSVAAQTVGVSLSCGSLWFIDAGSVRFVDTPISSRYLTQDDRIEIADGLNRGERVKDIAERIGKTYQSVYREIARNRKPDGTYQPWYAHGQAYQRRRRPKTRRLAADDGLRMAVAKKLSKSGLLPRSVAGCGADIVADRRGISALRRSTRVSTGAWLSTLIKRPATRAGASTSCGPAGFTDIDAGGDGLVTAL